jgi:hypothetical protein
MAKSDADRSKKKYDREKADLERLGGRICRFHLPEAPDKALATLQEWGELEDWREVFSTIALNLVAAGKEVALPFLAVARHEIHVTPSVARKLEAFAKRESGRDDDE